MSGSLRAGRMRHTMPIGGSRALFIAITCSLMVLSAAHATGAEILWNRTLTQDVTDLSISEDGEDTAVAAEWIQLFDSGGNVLWRQWVARRVLISGDGRYVAAGSYGSVRLVDVRGKNLWEREIDGEISALATTSDMSRLAAGTLTGSVYIFSNSGELLGKNTTNTVGGTAPVRDIAISDDGACTAAITSRAVFLLNRTSYPLWERLNETLFDGKYVSISRSCDLVAAAGKYELYRLHSGGETLWRYSANGEITALATIYNHSLVALGTRDGRVILLDGSGSVRGIYATGRMISRLSISRNGDRILASSLNGGVYLLDSDAVLLDSAELGRMVRAVALIPSGEKGVAATVDGLFFLRFSGSFPAAMTVTPGPPTPSPTRSIPTIQIVTTAETSPPEESGPSETIPPVTRAGFWPLSLPFAIVLAIILLPARR
ncbi:MAG: hypothetical protein QHG99_03425 [Methanomicrobiales archaeon]|nr:hypothetical protein [Methanomicrobiales archaeon]